MITEHEWNEQTDLTGGFAAIEYIPLELGFDEAMAFESRDWEVFAKACRDASGVSRARPRMSNVSVDEPAAE